MNRKTKWMIGLWIVAIALWYAAGSGLAEQVIGYGLYASGGTDNKPGREVSRLSVLRNQSYPVQGGSQIFDVYAPVNFHSRRYPLFIWLHGGGWFKGDKSDWLSVNLARHAAGLGFVVFDVDYRLVDGKGGNAYPVAPNDVRDFTAYLAANLEKYNADASTKVSIGGHSAGGHLAMLEAVRGEGALHYACVVSVAGLSDLSTNIPEQLQRIVDGFVPAEQEKHDASPVNHVATWGAPQVLFVHAEDDDVVPIAQSLSMGDLLSKAKKAEVHYATRRSGGHDLASPITNEALDGFLPKHCG